MIDPPRILDETGTDADAVLERALLRAARGRAPSAEARRMAAAALGLEGNAARTDAPAVKARPAPISAPEESLAPLFASVLRRERALGGRFWPGALAAVAAHAAVLALALHAAPPRPAEPPAQEYAETRFLMAVPRAPGAAHGEAPVEREQEGPATPPAKGGRPSARVAAGERAGDPVATPKGSDEGAAGVAVPPPRQGPAGAGAEATSDEQAAGFAAGEGTEVLSFGEGMTPPRLVEGPDPVYPREAREAKVEGTMLVRCVITTTGTLQGCRVIKSLPFLEGPVLDALARRRYTPVTFQGRPVNVAYVIPFRFELP